MVEDKKMIIRLPDSLHKKLSNEIIKIEEEKLDTARRMLNQDYSLENIEKCTGLKVEQIKDLMR
jgi:hypothetical protein